MITKRCCFLACVGVALLGVLSAVDLQTRSKGGSGQRLSGRVITVQDMSLVRGDSAQCWTTIPCSQGVTAGTGQCSYCATTSSYNVCCNCASGSQQCSLNGGKWACGGATYWLGTASANPDNCGRVQCNAPSNPATCLPQNQTAKGNECPCTS